MPKRIVTSRDNPAIKALRALSGDAREIRRQGRTLIDGPHLVDVYHRRLGAPDLLVVSQTGRDNPEVAALLETLPAVETLEIPDALFREVSGGGTPVGILAAIPIPAATARDVSGSCVLLDAVQDAGNVGTIMRTAAAAGIRDVLLGTGCAGAWTPRVLRAGQGAHFSLRICEQADLLEFVRIFRGTSVATMARGTTSLFDLRFQAPVAWIFGNEGAGVDQQLAAAASQRVTIPLAAETESLNVGAAAAICLFEEARQRHADHTKNERIS